jgi:hypothetical protein
MGASARETRAERRLSAVFLRRFLDFSNGHKPSNGIIDIKTVGLFAWKALANLAGSTFRAGYNFGKAFKSADLPFNGQPALSPYDTMKGLHSASPIIAHSFESRRLTRSITEHSTPVSSPSSFADPSLMSTLISECFRKLRGEKRSNLGGRGAGGYDRAHLMWQLEQAVVSLRPSFAGRSATGPDRLAGKAGNLRRVLIRLRKRNDRRLGFA